MAPSLPKDFSVAELTDDDLINAWASAAQLSPTVPLASVGDWLGGLADYDPDDEIWAGIQRQAFFELRPVPLRPWRAMARPAQLPPPGRWRHWLVMAGRGFGKSWMGANWLAERALAEKGDYAVVAPTLGDAKKICVESESGLLVALGGEGGPDVVSYNRSDYVIHLVNGSRIILGSADAPQRIRGLNLRAVWCDEVGSWSDPTVWNEGIKFATRKGDPRIVITTTPTRGNKILVKLLDRHHEAGGSILGGLAGNTVLTRGSTRENVANLSADWLQEIEEEFAGTELGRQELDGELLHAVPGALITMDIIEQTRLTMEQAPIEAFRRIAVSVDPSVSSSEDADECGIIVMGVGPAPLGWILPKGVPPSLADAPHLYILEDRSTRATPETWARDSLVVAEEWQADVLTAEVNNGGDLVGTMTQMVSQRERLRMPHFHPVHAAVGKRTRAEPVGGVWQQHCVHPVGRFKKLEDQWTTWVPGSGMPSPDRFDASVWGGVELIPRLGVKAKARVRAARRGDDAKLVELARSIGG